MSTTTISLLASIVREAIASMRLEAEVNFNPADKLKMLFVRLLVFFAILAATTNFYRNSVLAESNKVLRKQVAELKAAADSGEMCRADQVKNQTDASSDSQRGSGLKPPLSWLQPESDHNP